METIFYSVAGEGRGHAIRLKTVAEELGKKYRLVIFASGHAYSFLQQTFAHTDFNIVVEKIPGLLFHYSRCRLNPVKTLWEAGKYLMGLNPLVLWLQHQIKKYRATLAITDFEPALPRAAQKCGIPFISLDHQHFLTVSDLTSLPMILKAQARLSEPFVAAYYQGQVETIVSSFYFPPLRQQYKASVIQTGVLLRPEILRCDPGNDGHLLVYLRRFSSPNIMSALKACGRPVKIYGLGEMPRQGNLEFYPVSDQQFIDDLTRCEALMSNAGNQLIGEAMYLGKPVFGIPEARNFEQFINAHYIQESGGGEWCRTQQFNLERLMSFLDRREDYICTIDREQLNGNPVAIAAIEKHLIQPATQPSVKFIYQESDLESV